MPGLFSQRKFALLFGDRERPLGKQHTTTAPRDVIIKHKAMPDSCGKDKKTVDCTSCDLLDAPALFVVRARVCFYPETSTAQVIFTCPPLAALLLLLRKSIHPKLSFRCQAVVGRRTDQPSRRRPSDIEPVMRLTWHACSWKRERKKREEVAHKKISKATNAQALISCEVLVLLKWIDPI
jgi:hypothetical protein